MLRCLSTTSLICTNQQTMKNKHLAPNNEKLTLMEVIAMGIVGMVGGGIFSVLGLAIAQAGHAAPFAFALGGAGSLSLANQSSRPVLDWSYLFNRYHSRTGLQQARPVSKTSLKIYHLSV